MIELEVIKVALPLKKKFRVARGEADIKINLLTILNNRYFGEASPSVHYGPDLAELQSEIERGLQMLRTMPAINRQTMMDVDEWTLHPTAKAAIMGMVLNYLSGESHRYPWEIMELSTPLGIRSSWTISIDQPQKMLEEIKSCPYPIVKVKMGNEEDILLLDAIGEVKNKEIRVDANGGWSCAKAEEMIVHLSRQGVRIIEQPTDIQHVAEWPHLKRKNAEVELIMDEGLNNLADYQRHARSVDGINIKPEKTGGIIEAMRLARQAQQDNKKVMLGCMVGSSVGIAQAVYMSSEGDYFDLDGPLLLESDIALGIRYDRETIAVDREIIGGPKLRRDVVQKYIQK